MKMRIAMASAMCCGKRHDREMSYIAYDVRDLVVSWATIRALTKSVRDCNVIGF